MFKEKFVFFLGGGGRFPYKNYLFTIKFSLLAIFNSRELKTLVNIAKYKFSQNIQLIQYYILIKI